MQTINLNDRLQNSVLQFTGIKNSFYGKAHQRLKEIYLVKQQPQEQPQKSHEQDIRFDKNIFRSIYQSLRPTGRVPWIILRLWRFYTSGTQDAEATKSLYGRAKLKRFQKQVICRILTSLNLTGKRGSLGSTYLSTYLRSSQEIIILWALTQELNLGLVLLCAFVFLAAIDNIPPYMTSPLLLKITWHWSSDGQVSSKWKERRSHCFF